MYTKFCSDKPIWWKKIFEFKFTRQKCNISNFYHRHCFTLILSFSTIPHLSMSKNCGGCALGRLPLGVVLQGPSPNSWILLTSKTCIPNFNSISQSVRELSSPRTDRRTDGQMDAVIIIKELRSLIISSRLLSHQMCIKKLSLQLK